MTRERFLGIVQDRLFRRLTPIRDLGVGCRLSRLEAGVESAEEGEILLDLYEGSAILVEGEAQELWIHAAEVIEKASPIVTELVQFVLGHPVLKIDPKPQAAP